MTRKHDSHAIDGKIAAPDEAHDVIVVGAGPAGLTAALEAARAGRQVLLIDEHPVAAALAGSDVPLWFGGRATSALQAPERLIETLVETEPLIAEAFEAGIDVRLGVTAWGATVTDRQLCPRRCWAWPTGNVRGRPGIARWCWPPVRATVPCTLPDGISPG